MIAPNVNDTGLKDLMNTIHAGLVEAVERKDPAQLAYAAKLDLDAVDLLERHWVEAYKTGSGALPAADADDQPR